MLMNPKEEIQKNEFTGRKVRPQYGKAYYRSFC